MMSFRGLIYVIIALVIFSALASFLSPAFWLVVLLIIVAVLYSPIRRHFVPKGRRIKHDMLKSYLTNKYGREGKGVYKDIVVSLRRRGYR